MNTLLSTIKCDKCGSTMKEIARERVMIEPDFEDLTEGQLADYEAAQLSGEYGDWAETQIIYLCENCKATFLVVH